MSLKKLRKMLIFVGVLFFVVFAQNRPFPMALEYPGVVKPTNVTQSSMNSSVQNVYNAYKTNYLQTSNQSGQYYIKSGGTGASGTLITISEAHGYGMMIFALMAGYDSNAKTYFDGMYNFYKRFPSKEDNNFMSWEILQGETGGSNSATDGDMDIAYALLLAHDQWGSTGGINYLSEAKRIIGAIKNSIISSTTNRIKLGDWAVDAWNANNKYNTRSSDWMTGHLRAYKKATSDTKWDAVATEVYQCVSEITSSYSASTGLMPDFATGATAAPDANSGGTGEYNGDKFYYNACRYPWRITMDYYHYNTSSSKAAATKIMDWASTKTGNDPSKFYPGYTLSGNALMTSYIDGAFVGPIVVASTVDAKYQTFLNNGWTDLAGWNNGNDGVYGDGIRLLSMLVISGNWWAPGEALPNTGKTFTITATAGTGGTISPSGSVVVDSASAKIFTITPNSGYEISDVKVNGTSVGANSSYTFSSVSTNQTIAATFSKVQYTINATAGTGGTISPSGNVSVDHGSNQSFSISANSGYKIDSVIVDGINKGSVSSWTFNSVTAPRTIRAVFRQLFTISASSNSGGSISPAGDVTIAKGASQSYSITPNTGYNIESVTVDGSNKGAISSYSFSNVTADHTIVAAFKSVPTYTISTSVESGASISPSGTVVVTEGDSRTFDISVSQGYAIASVTVDGTDLGVVTSYTFTNVTSNHSISVSTRVVPTYKITATAGTGGSISPSGSVTVSESMSETFDITAANGYNIKAVLVDGVDQGKISSYTFSNVTAAHTISASFELKTYTLTASAGANGSISPSGATEITHGESQTYTFTPASGYIVDSVKLDGNYVGSSSSYTVANIDKNHTISVSFKMPVYEITATAGSNGSISPEGTITLSKGDNQSFQISANSSYRIDSVFVDGEYVGRDSVFNFTNVLESHTIHATFKFKVPTVYITNTHGGYVELDNGQTIYASGEYEVGNPKKPQNFHFVAESGYQLDSVVVDGSNMGSIEYYSQKVRQDVSMLGYFSPTGASYTLAISAGVGGSANPTGNVVVASGDDVTIAITPDFGYVIDDVLVGGSSQGAVSTYTFSNVTANGTLSATFKAVAKHVISATANAGGTISPLGEISVNDGDSKTFTITADANWLIDQVLVDGSDQGAIGSYTFNNVSAPHSIQAVFKELPKHTISAIAGVGGSISPSGNIQIAEGENASFDISVDLGYLIDSVLVDGVNQGSITTYQFNTVLADHTIKVVYKEVPKFVIKATAGSGGSISPIGNVEVLDGDNQKFTISALSGFLIDAVLIDGSDLGALNEYTFTSVSSNHTIEANFVPDGTPIGPVSKVKNSPFTVLLSQNPIHLNTMDDPDLVIKGKGSESISQVELILYDAVGNELYSDQVYKYSRNDAMIIPIKIKDALIYGTGSYLILLKISDHEGGLHLHKLMMGVRD